MLIWLYECILDFGFVDIKGVRPLKKIGQYWAKPIKAKHNCNVSQHRVLKSNLSSYSIHTYREPYIWTYIVLHMHIDANIKNKVNIKILLSRYVA